MPPSQLSFRRGGPDACSPPPQPEACKHALVSGCGILGSWALPAESSDGTGRRALHATGATSLPSFILERRQDELSEDQLWSGDVLGSQAEPA